MKYNPGVPGEPVSFSGPTRGATPGGTRLTEASAPGYAPGTMRQLWAPWRMEYVGRDHDDGECVLCRVVAGSSAQERHVVERAPDTLTVLNLYPYSTGHLMVLPHRHVAELVDLSAEEAAAVVEAARRAVRALRLALRPDGFNLGINQGRCAGAGITDHVHLHVVPRWEGDTNFMPVVGDVKVLPEHLDVTAEKVRRAYAADKATGAAATTPDA